MSDDRVYCIDPDEIDYGTLALLLVTIASEVLPFLGCTKANGVLHSVTRFLDRVTKRRRTHDD